MAQYKSDFLNTLSTRGYIHQCSDFAALDALAAGGKAIALRGGGTTRVGDPSGRDESRKILTLDDIEDNKRGIQLVFAKFLKFGTAPKDAIMLDNAEWLTKLNWIDMLRDVGKHFSVNRMLTMDSVKLRLDRDGAELSFIEFNYMVLQAYDFVELAKRQGCNLQMGGSDQWGNIVNGIDLGRRMGTHQLYALTSPLITLASGAKMGKTAAGAVWLNADMRSPYEYWQFWRNTEDADVGRFLKLFTTSPLDEIAKLEKLGGSEINEAKKVLANAATALVHGQEAADAAAETARMTFEEGGAAQGLPSVAADLPISVLQALVQAGLCSSNGDAKRNIQGGAIKVNDEVVSNDKLMLDAALLNAEGAIKLSMGKKKHVLLKPR